MKRLSFGLVALMLSLGSTSGSMAQGLATVAIVFTDKAGVIPTRDNAFEVHYREFYWIGPIGSIPATAIQGRPKPVVSKFNVRGWWEQAQIHVVVSAVVPDERAPHGETETPIAERFMKAGSSTTPPTWRTDAEFDEGLEWNAGPIFVSVIPATSLPPRSPR